MAEALAANSALTSLDLSFNQVGDEGAGRLAEALATNSTLSTLDLRHIQARDEGAMRLAEALVINSSLTEVKFDWDSNTRRLVDAHLDRNKGNLKKKSASLFFMLMPSLSFDGDETNSNDWSANSWTDSNHGLMEESLETDLWQITSWEDGGGEHPDDSSLGDYKNDEMWAADNPFDI